MPSERVTLANVNQLIGLARQNPGILNIGGLATFRGQTTVATLPGCSKCGSGAKLAELRPQFEAALLTLSGDEKIRLKTLLDTNTVCFYTKQPNGELKQHCF
jgi:hypothetical protein